MLPIGTDEKMDEIARTDDGASPPGTELGEIGVIRNNNIGIHGECQGQYVVVLKIW